MIEGLKEELAMELAIPVTTTSSTDGTKTEVLRCMPLRKALAFTAEYAVRVSSADGMSLLLSPADLDRAVLAEREGMVTLAFPQDSHRRRWIKQPQSFTPISCEE